MYHYPKVRWRSVDVKNTDRSAVTHQTRRNESLTLFARRCYFAHGGFDMRKFFNLMLGAALVSSAAFAQSTTTTTYPGHNASDDAFQIRYAANLAAGQSVIDLTNGGTLGGYEPWGNICANVYVFAEDQQLIACCACELTPNHLQSLSVQNDLISNTLTPGVPIGVTIGLLATQVPSSGTCDAANPSGGYNANGQGERDVNTVGGLRAWGTTLHAAPGGGFAVTETEFSKVKLSDSEADRMIKLCGFIEADGSGYGICGSCKVGAAGATKQ
jgi:hypothetical protein